MKDLSNFLNEEEKSKAVSSFTTENKAEETDDKRFILMMEDISACVALIVTKPTSCLKSYSLPRKVEYQAEPR